MYTCIYTYVLQLAHTQTHPETQVNLNIVKNQAAGSLMSHRWLFRFSARFLIAYMYIKASSNTWNLIAWILLDVPARNCAKICLTHLTLLLT